MTQKRFRELTTLVDNLVKNSDSTRCSDDLIVCQSVDVEALDLFMDDLIAETFGL